MATILVTNATPGGPVSPEVYAGNGVRFTAGSALVQTSSTLADTSKLTISMWVKRLSGDSTYLFSADVNDGNRITAGINTPAFLASDLNLTLQNTAGGGAAAFNTLDGLTVGTWHHVYITVDTDFAAGLKQCTFYKDGVLWTQYAVGYPVDGGGAFNIGLLGASLGFPGSMRVLEENPAVDLSDVQVWTDKVINPSATQTRYSAKPDVSQTVLDVVNYMNSRGVSPLEALAAMKIESNFGRSAGGTTIRNYFQFLEEESFDLILGFDGKTTNATHQNKAFANAWSGAKAPVAPSTTWGVVGDPNNYDRLVRQITGATPEPFEKFIIHNLGGSVSTIGATGSINGYRLLSAYVQNPELTLGQVGPGPAPADPLGLMKAQTSIYGTTGPLGPTGVTTSTTVEQAIGAMISVWTAAEAAALAKLDTNTGSNLSYFRSDDGRAVPYYAATERFGLQTFLFTGIKEIFAINQGSGGDMTLVGTLTDVAGPND